jgi:hypothetical protein
MAMKVFLKILLFIIAFLVISKLLTLTFYAMGGLLFTIVVGVIAWILVGKLLGK